ncbi:MAG: hypothetical protein M1831_004874 [Alyxoria varia]|nr:MAG: hypothetical protein M1831_004874 [Alyxoria varia]
MAKQPKSILKAPSAGSATSSAPTGPSETRADDPNYQRNLQIALHHANKIQHRKDGEAAVFDALCELLELPSSTSASAAAPSVEDADRFRTLIEPFTPADYDELVQERNISKKCGYVLCPKELTARQQALFNDNSRQGEKIDWAASKRVAKDEPLAPLVTTSRNPKQMWCSKDCDRRATFVKLQLSPVPFWERNRAGFVNGGVGSASGGVKFLQADDETALLHKMEKMSLETEAPTHEERMERAMTELALERGESEGSSSGTIASVTTSDVRERTVGSWSGP